MLILLPILNHDRWIQQSFSDSRRTMPVNSIFPISPQAVVEEPCSPPPILEEAEIAFALEIPPSAMRSSSSSSSGSYDLKDAMVDPNHELDQVVPPSGHTSETELDRDVSARDSAYDRRTKRDSD